jgi:cephalosporin hydroxylase
MMTRQEFEGQRRQMAAQMAEDDSLRGKVLGVLVHSDRYNWFHQMSWAGEPSLSFPQDLFAVQELVYRLRPRYIIETGVAWGGSLLFYAGLLELFGGEKVLGIDLYLPDDLRERLETKGNLSRRLLLREGSSTARDTLDWVADVLDGETRNIVILDSAHGHRHVLEELVAYAPFVGPGYYVVCCDTVIEGMPPQTHRPRAWGPGNSPATAVDAFLKAHPEFAPDRELEDKLLITCQPGGYLRRADVDL